MSHYPVLRDVAATLRDLLWADMQADNTITQIIPNQQRITFDLPSRLVRDDQAQEDRLSIYLYRVCEDADMKNRPPQPDRLAPNQLRYPPLSLDLFYLITPLSGSAENDHLLLAKTMQVFYDNGCVQGSALRGLLRNNTEELRIILNPISVEDLAKLWSAFLRPYRLSVSYEVKVVYVDSLRQESGERVRRKRLEFREFEVVP